jgi:hypothetical protein
MAGQKIRIRHAFTSCLYPLPRRRGNISLYESRRGPGTGDRVLWGDKNMEAHIRALCEGRQRIGEANIQQYLPGTKREEGVVENEARLEQYRHLTRPVIGGMPGAR